MVLVGWDWIPISIDPKASSFQRPACRGVVIGAHRIFPHALIPNVFVDSKALVSCS